MSGAKIGHLQLNALASYGAIHEDNLSILNMVDREKRDGTG
jgi:hypothetical protein